MKISEADDRNSCCARWHCLLQPTNSGRMKTGLVQNSTAAAGLPSVSALALDGAAASDLLLQKHNPVKKGFGSWWTSRYVDVDGYDSVAATDSRVGIMVVSSAVGARSHRDAAPAFDRRPCASSSLRPAKKRSFGCAGAPVRGSIMPSAGLAGGMRAAISSPPSVLARTPYEANAGSGQIGVLPD